MPELWRQAVRTWVPAGPLRCGMLRALQTALKTVLEMLFVLARLHGVGFFPRRMMCLDASLRPGLHEHAWPAPLLDYMLGPPCVVPPTNLLEVCPFRSAWSTSWAMLPKVRCGTRAGALNRLQS